MVRGSFTAAAPRGKSHHCVLYTQHLMFLASADQLVLDRLDKNNGNRQIKF